MPIRFDCHRFCLPIDLPAEADVLDLSLPEADRAPRTSAFSIGRYDEKRCGVYTTELFEGRRDVHMGIDLGAPAGTEVRAFCRGRIFRLGLNSAPGDYGPTLITEHELDGVLLYALHGHLSPRSLEGWTQGAAVEIGQRIGWVGAHEDNGGWPPHLHFQLSYRRPTTHDLPGVVSEAEREAARRDFPDPRLVLGPLY